MQWHEIVYGLIAFALGSFLILSGYILQRDRYWQYVWRSLGKPQVESIKELRDLVRKQDQAVTLNMRTHTAIARLH